MLASSKEDHMTKADFYLGHGLKGLWLGSVLSDGGPEDPSAPVLSDGVPLKVLAADTETGFLASLEEYFSSLEDAIRPTRGGPWPWPWRNSSKTDYAYVFFDGRVWISEFGGPWYHFFDRKLKTKKPIKFPDMTRLLQPEDVAHLIRLGDFNDVQERTKAAWKEVRYLIRIQRIADAQEVVEKIIKLWEFELGRRLSREEAELVIGHPCPNWDREDTH